MAPLQELANVALEDNGSYVAYQGPSERTAAQIATIQGFLDSNIAAEESVATKHAVVRLQGNGHPEATELCVRYLKADDVEVDGVVVANNCALIVEHKTKLGSANAKTFATKMGVIRSIVASGSPDQDSPVAKLAGKRLLPVLCGRIITTNTTDLNKMEEICRANEIEVWDVSGSGVELSSGCFKSPHVHHFGP
ncbi:hypothetical protein HYH03_016283 [Edaphochlamys debaryana]|uniref:Uncharacterized protein n=1 Tax=Edaphochlamys debaryana TaxID=47281 RepID=A0A836BQC4_9CHLO|nr:hypothetical protein HYH03_016283 [Edaphochlamys debaryana]|eukprot:KAG2484990.1 hypothetical protein HYH03_016283 [Edaphochlamys debaryana]